VKCSVIERWLSKLQGRKEGMEDIDFQRHQPWRLYQGENTFHQNAIKHAEFCIKEEEYKIG